MPSDADYAAMALPWETDPKRRAELERLIREQEQREQDAKESGE